MNEWFLYMFIIYTGGTYQPIWDTFPTESACVKSAKELAKDYSNKGYATCIHIGELVDKGRKISSQQNPVTNK